MAAAQQPEMVPAEHPGALNVLQSAEEARAIQEVQAALTVAKRFPRDTTACIARIRAACRREGLAKVAFYSYTRGKPVTGVTIRLMEVIAVNWGNIRFGLRELSQSPGVSEIEAFAWDVETNTMDVRVFKVQHARFSHEHGLRALTDPRDVYEHIANYGARRLRSCLEHVIPSDVIEAAKEQCLATLAGGDDKGKKSMIDRMRALIDVLARDYGVTAERIAAYFEHPLDQCTYDEFGQLHGIYNSLKDGEATASELFGGEKAEGKGGAADAIKQAGGKSTSGPTAPPAVEKSASSEPTDPPGEESRGPAGGEERSPPPPPAGGAPPPSESKRRRAGRPSKAEKEAAAAQSEPLALVEPPTETVVEGLRDTVANYIQNTGGAGDFWNDYKEQVGALNEDDKKWLVEEAARLRQAVLIPDEEQGK